MLDENVFNAACLAAHWGLRSLFFRSAKNGLNPFHPVEVTRQIVAGDHIRSADLRSRELPFSDVIADGSRGLIQSLRYLFRIEPLLVHIYAFESMNLSV